MLRNPKITFMTTLGINVGDEFIRDGIFSFFDEILDSYSPFYVNKHDLDTLKRTCEDENLTLHDKFLDADIIVQAGAPVYWNLGESTCYNVSWAKELWEDRIFRLGEKKIIFNIAAGSCQPYPGSAGDVADDPKCAAFARQVDQACCWNSVRDPLASEILTHLGLKHEALPCTAFHAARRYPLPHNTYGNVLAVNLMPLGGHFRLKEEISEELWGEVIQEMLPHLRKYHHLLFVAHTLDEKKFMERWRSGSEVIFYSPRWRDYLPVYANCIFTLANRVHGAVCAAGFGRPSVIVGNDTRLQIGQFIDIPSRYVASITAREIVDLVETGLKNSASERERLLELRERSAQRYCTAISEKICNFTEKRNHHLSNIPTMVKTNSKKPQGDRSVQTSKAFSLETCQNILIPRFDTFGDIILLDGFIGALLDLLPESKITLLVRENYDQLAEMYPSRLIWKTTGIDPYRNKPNSADVISFLEEFKANAYDLVLFTTYNRTWLDDMVAISLSPARRVAIGGAMAISNNLFKVLGDLGIDSPSCPYDEFVTVEEKIPETEKYQILWERLSGDKNPLSPPQLSVSGDMVQKARKVLRMLGLDEGAFFVCAPAGSVNVSVKKWPEENFATIIADLEERFKLKALVVGHTTEKRIINKVVRLAKGQGAHPEAWLGKDGEMPLACALAKESSFYFGNDTGLMHMSAALDKPILAIFGGGTWPRFVPCAKTGRAFVLPMSCFYCKWDCYFEEALCMSSLSNDTITREIETFVKEMDQRKGKFKIVQTKANKHQFRIFFENSVEQIKELKRLSKEIEADREARLEVIQRQQKEFSEQIREIEADREARLEVIQRQQKELSEKVQEIEANQEQIREIEADRAARLEVIHSYQKELQETQQQLKATEAAYQETVNSLQETIALLSSGQEALKIVMKKIGFRLGLSGFIRRHNILLNRIYLWMLHPFRPFHSNRSKKKMDSTLSIRSPLVEAFIVARSWAGGLDDMALELFYEMGRDIQQVLCIHPSPETIQALYMLSRAGAQTTCLTGEQHTSDQLTSNGIACIHEDPAGWMVNSGKTSLADYDCLVLDSGIEEYILLHLKGRLWPKNKIIITRSESDANPSMDYLRTQGRLSHGVIILDSPPPDWLDPTHQNRSFYQQTGLPWQHSTLNLPPSLPSGRPWPKISVVTVTLDQGDYLEETLQSVLLQGYPNLEYIVLDGGSTDKTPEILDRYRDKLAFCRSEKDNGQADALNKGFRLATGDILSWLNSDDRYYPETLLRVALAFDTYDTDLIAGGCALLESNNKYPFRTHHSVMPIGQVVPLPLDRLLDIDGSWQKGDFFYQPEVFWSRDIWSRSGARLDEKLFYSMDYELWVRMALHGARIVHIPDTLVCYRCHENQKTYGSDLPFLPELRQVNAEFKRKLKK